MAKSKAQSWKAFTPKTKRTPAALASRLQFRAVELVRRATPAELVLWEALKDGRSGVWFEFQVPHGRFILDFYCSWNHIAIEVDGGYHNAKEQITADLQRQYALERDRVLVLRFSNDEVLTGLADVLRVINMAVVVSRFRWTVPERKADNVRRSNRAESQVMVRGAIGASKASHPE